MQVGEQKRACLGLFLNSIIVEAMDLHRVLFQPNPSDHRCGNHWKWNRSLRLWAIISFFGGALKGNKQICCMAREPCFCEKSALCSSGSPSDVVEFLPPPGAKCTTVRSFPNRLQLPVATFRASGRRKRYRPLCIAERASRLV